jgi:hypothetical protein
VVNRTIALHHIVDHHGLWGRLLVDTMRLCEVDYLGLGLLIHHLWLLLCHVGHTRSYS